MTGLVIFPAHEGDEQSLFSDLLCFDRSLSGEPYGIKDACEFFFRQYLPLSGDLKNRFAG